MSSLDIICPYIEKDKDRFLILWKSLEKFLKIDNYRLFLVSPSGKGPIKSSKLICIKECDLDSNLSNSSYDNYGWWKQQIIKLLSHKICSSDHILSLDCDCFLNKDLSLDDIIINKKSKLRISSGGSWNNWYVASKHMLKLPYKLDSNNTVDVTPFIFSKNILKGLDNYLSIIYQNNHIKYLLDNTALDLANGHVWTEYSLYHIYSDYTGMIDRYHYIDPNFELYGNCFWNEKEANDWNPSLSFDNPKHFFTVAQSTAKKSAEWVNEKIKDYLR